jgi:hypothetical protein
LSEEGLEGFTVEEFTVPRVRVGLPVPAGELGRFSERDLVVALLRQWHGSVRGYV